MRSSGCALEGIRGCGPAGEFWRESEGAVQWVCSGGNQRVWPSGCVLEGIRGCGLVGVFRRERVHSSGCALEGIRGCGPVGVF